MRSFLLRSSAVLVSRADPEVPGLPLIEELSVMKLGMGIEYSACCRRIDGLAHRTSHGKCTQDVRCGAVRTITRDQCRNRELSCPIAACTRH
jgi:hypothetical protein